MSLALALGGAAILVSGADAEPPEAPDDWMSGPADLVISIGAPAGAEETEADREWLAQLEEDREAIVGIPVQYAGPREFDPPRDSDCLRVDENGDQVSEGQETLGLSAMAEEMSGVKEAHRDAVAGVAYCYDYGGVAVMVAEQTSELMKEIEAVAARYPSLRVDVRPAAAGAEPVAEISRVLIAESEFAGSVTLAGLDSYKGGLKVGVRPEALNIKGGAIGSETIHSWVLKNYGLDLPVQLGASLGMRTTSRAVDGPAYYMGSKIVSNPGGRQCSSGIAVKGVGISGNGIGLLTAGHCAYADYWNGSGSALVGHQFTTSYPSNAQMYGDFKILSGSTYNNRIWTGGVTGTDTMPIVSANWQTLAEGRGVCTSGSEGGGSAGTT
jgi:hypothetical protein